MTALTANRDTPARTGALGSLAVAAATNIFAGSIVCKAASGFATKGATALNLVALGRATRHIDNSAGADGDAIVTYEPGCFALANAAGADEITAADIGSDCYIVDDQTVAKTNGGGTRSRAGVIEGLDDSGAVWVWLGVQY